MPVLTPVLNGDAALDVDVPDNALRVLVTGYGPFFRYRINPCWMAVEPLNNALLSLDDLPSFPPDGIDFDHPNGAAYDDDPQHVHVTALQLPLTFDAVVETVPGFHARPPVLPPAVAPHLAPPPEAGYDFIFHIGLAGRGPLRVERLGHKHGYRIKDTVGQHAPMLAASSTMARTDAAAPAPDIAVEQPLRGFSKGYENYPEDLHSPIDVERLVHAMKSFGVDGIYSSMDAGHYVCDFTYYCSLAEARRMAQKHDKGKHTKVLFMHCPPVDQPLSTEEVTDAIRKIILWVCKGEPR
ncbi:peptidase C15, pyroglutamyl peptidase I-like protein [Auriscalpium vulgare]|uniref:Peptidase C15, pyroglutamyl peptidase I-like protein n=1 Tax=Auriscalpium vulgare TaxID=40419 RepID=A0ACB8RV15_9AGAM|nr:peptidase C15, pyroglutamyl peptidase I-like protein [Auriscalpium vulgare]